jgi:chemotaxis protein MotB
MFPAMPRSHSSDRRFPLARRLALVAGPLVLMAAGCVPQDRYDSLLTANRSYQEQLAAAEADRDAARNELEMARTGVDRIRSENEALRGQVTALGGELEQLQVASEQALQELSSLELAALPQGITRALSELAARRPDLLQFDANLGMVRFASDVTFGLGSDALSSDASELLEAVASVLNLAEARGLAIEVVGHTDNVPIGQPATREKHPTNLHLSVHRAISVQRALVDAGIAAARVKVAGYGETRPIVPNPARGGAAANRRVEVYLIPQPAGTVFATVEPAIAAPAPAPAPARRPAPEPDK